MQLSLSMMLPNKPKPKAHQISATVTVSHADTLIKMVLTLVKLACNNRTWQNSFHPKKPASIFPSYFIITKQDVIGPYKTKKCILIVQIGHEVSSDIVEETALNFSFTPKNRGKYNAIYQYPIQVKFPQTFFVMTDIEFFFSAL